MDMNIILKLIPFGAVLLIIFAILFLGVVMYKKAPPNIAMVITGPGGSKTIIGKGCFVIPIIQRVDYMSLENIQADFTSRDEIPTKDAINILVDAVANISISKEPELLKIASSKFLGYNINQIKAIVTPVLEGNIREIVSQTTLKELIQGDKKVFAERIVENVVPNLRDMGLELTTFNIQNFKDKNGVIDNLGLENTVQISKDAAIAKAIAEREIAVAKAKAAQESNAAKVAADTEIAQKLNELAIRKAELKKESDIKAAEADAAYDIQKENQRKSYEVATANANLVRQEKEIELKEREISIKEKTLEANVKKEAEARKYAAQQDADAKLYIVQKQSEANLFNTQRIAEAEKFKAEKSAEANMALAEAEKFTKIQEAEAKKAIGIAEAEAIEARGRAEAEAIRAKAVAEAEGILKKAEAMKQYGEAAQMDMQLQVLTTYFEQLPLIAEAVAKPMANIDSITMYGEGNATKLTSDITSTMKQITNGVKDATGIDPMAFLGGVLGGKVAGHTESNN